MVSGAFQNAEHLMMADGCMDAAQSRKMSGSLQTLSWTAGVVQTRTEKAPVHEKEGKKALWLPRPSPPPCLPGSVRGAAATTRRYVLYLGGSHLGVYSDPTIRLQGAPASAGVQGQQRGRADRQATSEVKTLTKKP
jgi:hypothetical protein